MSSTFFQTFPEKPAAAVFLSGTGTNAAKLLEGWRSGAFRGWTPRVLVTDKPETSRARALAEQYGLPLVEHDIAKFYRERGLEKIALTSERALQVREEWTGALIRLLMPYSVQFGILAGFVPLSNITCVLPCLNVHPGDLTLDEDGRRYLAGLQRLPVETALLRGHTHLRSSVIIAQAFTGGAKEMDSGPVLGVSAPVPVDLMGATVDDLRACQAARAGKKPAEYRGDLLMQAAERNLENLKEHGDWVVFPQTVDDFARNKFTLDPDGTLRYEGTRVKTVEYSETSAPRPVPV